MTSNIIDVVREGIAQTLKEVTGFSSDSYSPAKINAPAFFPGPHSATPDADGGKVITFRWWVAVRASHESKQRDLDQALLDACDVIERNPTLGIVGGGVDAAWTGWDDYGDLEIGGTAYWGAILTIECYV